MWKETARLAAIVKGFLTRRMLDSEKIRNIITTIRVSGQHSAQPFLLLDCKLG